jgi:hypothetical protein
LAGFVSAPDWSTPETATTLPASAAGMLSLPVGALRILPRNAYLWTSTPNAVSTCDRVPVAVIEWLLDGTSPTCRPLSVRNCETAWTSAVVGAKRDRKSSGERYLP